MKINLSSHKIQEIYYINVDSEKKRNSDFLENYNKHSLEIPLHRISGIVPTKGYGNLLKGQLGCALSHIKVLKIISKKKRGWYLVCEDDCVGDFRNIEKKTKTIIKFHPFIQIINLYSPKGIKIFGIGTRLTGFLITPLGAKICCNILKKNIGKRPIDINLSRSPIMFIIGMHFKKLLYASGVSSTINKINNS